MFSRLLIAELKWVLLALAISFFLVNSIDGGVFRSDAEIGVPQTFLGLNLFLEILVFFVFSTFVVFGIKGFFEMYSRKFANVIIFISGVLMAALIFILSYQILSIE
ncbi:4-amino-4-deoxy-L-arabinose transferase-like glycosyltransferase [Flavobacterium sp. 28YEA47A]